MTTPGAPATATARLGLEAAKNIFPCIGAMKPAHGSANTYGFVVFAS